MRQRVWMLGLALAPIAIVGCGGGKSSWWSSEQANMRPQWQDSAVAVRFVMPPWPAQYSDSYEAQAWDWSSPSDTTAEAGYSESVKLTSSGFDGDVPHAPGEAYHVALWGGPWAGHNVTYTAAPLVPGDYTFAFIDQDKPAAAQGWLHVNNYGFNTLDMLKKWRAEIPRQKKWFAYDFEVKGRVRGGEPLALKSFLKQMRAYDRLERQLDLAIEREIQVEAQRQQWQNEFFHQTEVLLLPGQTGIFHPTTKPAFSEQDVNQLWNGQSVSKVLLVADYNTNKWKLDHLNQVYGDFGRFKSVLMEEADRLQRRKRYYTLTDHIYQHDQKFVQNELQLQLTYTAIDHINEQLAQLRERRLGLAFVNELFAPDTSWKWLSQEQQSLQREKVVLQAQKAQVDALFQQVDEASPQRIAFERNRQEVIAAIEQIDVQITQLGSARVALQTLKNQSDIIYRTGETSVLAASWIDHSIPFSVRDAIEHESLMTVRLDKADNFFAPSQVNSAWMQKVSSPVYNQPFQKPCYNP